VFQFDKCHAMGLNGKTQEKTKKKKRLLKMNEG
jgi:hypothetical protein